MSAPNPDEMSLLAKVLAAGVAIVGPIWGARTWIESRFAKKVDKDDFKDFIKEFTGRFEQHARDDREIQAKLFDRIDDLKTTMLERLK